MKQLVLAPWILALASSAPGLATDVLVVDPGGGGDFTRLDDALASAAPGDVILVRGGTYDGLTVGKAVSVVADTGTLIRLTGPLRVAGFDGSPVVLSGFVLPYGLFLTDVPSPVRVQRTLVGNEAPGWNPDAVTVTRCGDVMLARCTLAGGDGETDFALDGYGEDAGAGILVRSDSRVAMFRTKARGGRGGDADLAGLFTDALGGKGGHGAWVTYDSELYAMGSTFEGGDGGTGFAGGDGGAGGDGVFVASSETSIGRLADATLASGAGGAGGDEGFPGADGVDTEGPVEFLDVSRRALNGPTVVRELQPVTWTLVGLVDDVFFLPASLRPAHQYVAAAFGVRAFTRPLFQDLSVAGWISPDNSRTLQRVPEALAPGEEARILFHQIFVVDTQGRRILGEALAEVVIANGI